MNVQSNKCLKNNGWQKKKKRLKIKRHEEKKRTQENVNTKDRPKKSHMDNRSS